MAVSIGAESISVYNDGEFFSVDKTHANYNALLKELRRQPRDVAAVLELVEIPRFVSNITAGRVQIGADSVLFSGEAVSGYMVDKLLAMAHAGEPVASWALFMDNLMDNPLPGVREDLYKWMETGRMPITEDGCIVAFKKVNADYTDVHTGRFDNSVGATLTMDRELCDTDRNQTCSTGFHFCSAGYLREFGGSKVMVVKINPRDVTAIPKDYNNQKARCCQYTVTGELSNESAARHKVWTEKNVVNLENPQELPDVMLPRKGKPLSAVAVDPARAAGAPPADDLAGAAPVPLAKAVVPAQSPQAKRAAATPPPATPSVPTDWVAVPNAKGYKSNATGAVYSPEDLQQAMAAAGGKYSVAASAMQVPASTLKGWVKRA